jgi:hypothetical protein
MAARPIQCPEPSSEIANPHPPARAVSPSEFLPYAIEPVPAIAITPGSRPKAACSAITMSPTISISPATISATIFRTAALTCWLVPPAIPMQVREICFGFRFAAEQAWRMACESDFCADACPRRTMLLPAPAPLPSTETSSPSKQVVLLPPPSMPRKKATSVVLSQDRNRVRAPQPAFGFPSPLAQCQFGVLTVSLPR